MALIDSNTACIELKNASGKTLNFKWGKFKYSSEELGSKRYFWLKSSKTSGARPQIEIKKDVMFCVEADLGENFQSGIDALILKLEGYERKRIPLKSALSQLST